MVVRLPYWPAQRIMCFKWKSTEVYTTKWYAAYRKFVSYDRIFTAGVVTPIRRKRSLHGFSKYQLELVYHRPFWTIECILRRIILPAYRNTYQARIGYFQHAEIERMLTATIYSDWNIFHVCLRECVKRKFSLLITDMTRDSREISQSIKKISPLFREKVIWTGLNAFSFVICLPQPICIAVYMDDHISIFWSE